MTLAEYIKKTIRESMLLLHSFSHFDSPLFVLLAFQTGIIPNIKACADGMWFCCASNNLSTLKGSQCIAIDRMERKLLRPKMWRRRVHNKT